MNGNTTVLQRAIIGAQRIPHLKTPPESQREKEISLTVDNDALRTQVLSLQDKIVKLTSKPIRPRISDIVKEVCNYFYISEDEIKGRSRCVAIVRPRQIAIYLLRRCTPHSYVTIRKVFGYRDHGSAVHANNLIAGLRKTDEKINQQITAIESQFQLPNVALDPPGRASSEPASCSIPQGAGSLT